MQEGQAAKLIKVKLWNADKKKKQNWWNLTFTRVKRQQECRKNIPMGLSEIKMSGRGGGGGSQTLLKSVLAINDSQFKIILKTLTI